MPLDELHGLVRIAGTRRELARRAGVPDGTVATYLRGRGVPAETAERLRKAVRLSLSDGHVLEATLVNGPVSLVCQGGLLAIAVQDACTLTQKSLLYAIALVAADAEPLLSIAALEGLGFGALTDELSSTQRRLSGDPRFAASPIVREGYVADQEE
jgi:transcriptional regulator with XRE-family HTH domain